MDFFNVGFSLRVVPLDFPGVQADAMAVVRQWHQDSKKGLLDQRASTVNMVTPSALGVPRLVPALAVEWLSGVDWRRAHSQRDGVMGSLKRALDKDAPHATAILLLFDNDEASGNASVVLHGPYWPKEVFVRSSDLRDWLRAAGEPGDGAWEEVCKSPQLHQLILENVFEADVWEPVRSQINNHHLAQELPQGVSRPAPPRL